MAEDTRDDPDEPAEEPSEDEPNEDEPGEELSEDEPAEEPNDDEPGEAALSENPQRSRSKAPDTPHPPSIRTAARQVGRLYRNPLSYFGAAVMITGVALVVFAQLSQLTVDQPSPYVGIFTYVLFPAVAVFGALVLLFGMRREAKRRRTPGAATRSLPVIDFNRPEHRRWLAIMVAIGVAVFGGAGTGTYKAYLYTGSNEFCGTTCHTSMNPEWVAYLDSPHARVACVDCHIGSGAKYHVQAKLNGTKQLFETLTDSFPRPIPISTQQLRPARDTCEKCHWAGQFWAAKLKQVPHYRYDADNTAEQINLTLLIGGGGQHGRHGGIHWHMVIDNEVSYKALDDEFQEIPWVEVKRADGSVTHYVTRKLKVSQNKLDSLETRTMDCMDCHNRPAHAFPVPDRAIDEALYRGSIDETIPWIKQVTVEAINLHAEDDHAGAAAVAADVLAHYQKKLPDELAKRKEAIEQAARVASEIWKRSAFPEMNLTWKTYPSNIGHRYWPGCFRCHDGKHVAEDGRVLDNRCDGLCHTAPARGAIEPLGQVDPLADRELWHPWELQHAKLKISAHAGVACYKCHEAGRRPASECNDCHTKIP